ncbi:MAG TPA: alpha/beta hydrolase-fold protein [Chthoniobacterales bacterium]
MPHSPFGRQAPPSFLIWLLSLLWIAVPATYAGNPARVPVQFSITQDVGSGNEVFVSGTHRDLTSGGIQPWGVKLRWSPGNIWSGMIAIEAGTQISYSYVSHGLSGSSYCGGSSSTTLGAPVNLTVPSAPNPPYTGKSIRYVSAWSTANLLFRDNTQVTDWTFVPMHRVSQGRTPAESVFEVTSVAASADEIEFVFFDNNNHYDNAPAPPQNTPQQNAPAVPVPYQSLSAPYNYRTSLDVFAVQDGQVFSYQPPVTVSAPSIATRFVNSTVTGIPGRNIHIYVPRGYTENTGRRYPVVYFHDGQNVFFPGSSFGTWDADRIASYEISQGRMREAILVAIDNGDRSTEYIPPGDQISGSSAGVADKYVQFLRDNVLPTLDFNYRTLNQPGQPTHPAANITAGSSLGGLLTAYMGMTNSGVFGKVGVFSPSFWAGPNFEANTLNPAPKLPLSIYMDIGSDEDGDSSWFDAFNVYNTWLDKGYAVNSEFLMYPQCGAMHNEHYWSGRLPTFFQFVLNLWSEPNTIALEKFPPRLDLLGVDPLNGTAHLHFLAPLGIPFVLNRSTDLMSWPDTTSLAPATAIWEDRFVDEQFNVPANKRFWRLTY